MKKCVINNRSYNCEVYGVSSTRPGMMDVYVAELVTWNCGGKAKKATYSDHENREIADGKFFVPVCNVY